MGIRRAISNWVVGFLMEPLAHCERRIWNDPEALTRHIRKGDVLLVRGENRASAIVRYLTQSAWSHAGLYVGDELLRRGEALRETALSWHGDEADDLIIEALPEGVVATPLSKYLTHDIRLVRPHRLQAQDLSHVLTEAVSAIGWEYDLRNVLDLARYLLPRPLLPGPLRPNRMGSGLPSEVICSSLIAQLFQQVGFPILPILDGAEQTEAPPPARTRGFLLRRVLGHDHREYTALFKMRDPTLLTPGDFDLSPYFETVKFNVIADSDFDYRQIRWAGAGAGALNPPPQPEPVLTRLRNRGRSRPLATHREETG